jgi:DNA-binding GntR family transcriptional regulator
MAAETDGFGLGAAGQLQIRRSSTAEQAADLLRSHILSGLIPAGEPLREMRLAEAIGVSRNTMRETLRILGREGIITQDRHHIATVAEIHLADVGQIFEVRRLLETGAIGMVRGLEAPPDLRALRGACDRLALLREADPWMSVIEADRDFHVGLVALAGNPRLEAVYGRLESEIRMCLALTTRLHIGVEQIAAEHEEILAHLVRRDYDGAIAFVGETMDLAYGRVRRALERSA